MFLSVMKIKKTRGISAQKKTGLGRREGRKRDIPALLLAMKTNFNT